jgi:hypothetical protein
VAKALGVSLDELAGMTETAPSPRGRKKQGK